MEASTTRTNIKQWLEDHAQQPVTVGMGQSIALNVITLAVGVAIWHLKRWCRHLRRKPSNESGGLQEASRRLLANDDCGAYTSRNAFEFSSAFLGPTFHGTALNYLIFLRISAEMCTTLTVVSAFFVIPHWGVQPLLLGGPQGRISLAKDISAEGICLLCLLATVFGVVVLIFTQRMKGWEVVEVPKVDDVCKEAYRKIKSTAMKACAVEVQNKKLFFCLQPREALPKAESKLCASNLSGRCNTCIHRMPKFAQLMGDGGSFLAFSDVKEPNVQTLRQLRQKQWKTIQNVSELTAIVIDEDFAKEYPIEVGPFSHVHFICDQLSDAGLSQRLKDLKLYLNGSFDNRFQRLVDDPASLKVMQDALPRLVRPDHWRAVVQWAVNFVAEARGKSWDKLALHEKFHVMIYAMLTGRSHGNVHLDMQQASNLVDFMDTAANLEGLVAMMDDRSNPETYMVSRVAELLREKQVKSLCTVTLVWGLDGNPHKSDLDLHTWVKGTELYYGKKNVESCCLDFDANASRVERNPAENISLNQVGTFVMKVNNFNNRDAADVPFKLIVRRSGQESEVHEAVWPRNRAKGTLMEVCQVRVTPEDLVEKPVELSEAEQRKLAAKEAEWMQLFGEPVSTLACEHDLNVKTVNRPVRLAGEAAGYPSAQQLFTKILTAAPKEAKKKGSSLAERCQLETLDGFIQHVTEHESTVEVDIRNFVPGYITRLETETDLLHSKFAVNAFHRKYELPQQPRTDEQSMARFDTSWGLPATAAVHGFVQVNRIWFMILKGARLSPNSSDWPLAGGMYPTNLKPEAHHHRSKWASFHSLTTPKVPQDQSPLVIGSALVGFPNFQFKLDGRQVHMRVRSAMHPRTMPLLDRTVWLTHLPVGDNLTGKPFSLTDQEFHMVEQSLTRAIEEHIRKKLQISEEKAKTAVFRVHVPFVVDEWYDLDSRQKETFARLKMKRDQLSTIQAELHQHGCLCRCSPRLRIWWLSRQVRRLERKTQDLKHELDDMELSAKRMSGSAFVTFQERNYKATLLEDIPSCWKFHSYAYFNFGQPPFSSVTLRCRRAPHPADVLWENLHIPYYKRVLRLTSATLLLLVFMLVVVTPVSVSSELNTIIPELRKGSHVLRHAVEQRLGVFLPDRGGVWRWMSMQLPTMIILLINSLLLPLIIGEICRFTRSHTLSKVEVNQLLMNYVFLVLNQLLIPLLGLTGIPALLEFLEVKLTDHTQDISVLQLLDGSMFSSPGLFYVRYLLNCTFLTNTNSLLNLSQLVVRWLLSQHEPWIFAWGYWYAFTLAILTTAVNLGVLMPSLLPCGALFFAMKYRIDKHILSVRGFLCGPESQGLFIPRVLFIMRMIVAGLWLVIGSSLHFTARTFFEDRWTAPVPLKAVEWFSALLVAAALVVWLWSSWAKASSLHNDKFELLRFSKKEKNFMDRCLDSICGKLQADLEMHWQRVGRPKVDKAGRFPSEDTSLSLGSLAFTRRDSTEVEEQHGEQGMISLVWHCRSWLSSWTEFATRRNLPADLFYLTYDGADESPLS
eukprot:s5826_g4.t2